jgi:hypothetical protein
MIDFLQFEPHSFNPECMLDIPSGRGALLRCVFSKIGDRLAHAFFILNSAADNEPLGVCTSIEGNECEAWPASPPLQSMSIEQHTTGPVALLVGMAGRSHWSASFAAITDKKKLVVEIACRVGGEPVRLGSSYFFGGNGSLLTQVNATQLLCELGEHKLEITTSLLKLADAEVCITPPSPWNVKPVQWKYEIAWV